MGNADNTNAQVLGSTMNRVWQQPLKATSRIVTRCHMSSTPPQTYTAAVEALKTITGLRAERAASKNCPDAMTSYVERLGLRLRELPVIHVAGSKGKGSTCAFVESMLREHGLRTGLFTSPHLIDVRERIRLGGVPLSEEQFAEHFWHCWNVLEQSRTEEFPEMPGFFRFLTLVGLRVFEAEQVDAAILEVGLGGTMDATNVVPAPVVCGITSLGLEHTNVLGNTLALIAREKAGILKPGHPAFVSPQEDEAMEVVKEVAVAVGAPLEVIGPDPTLQDQLLGIRGAHQQLNASLSLALVQSFMQQQTHQGPAFDLTAAARGLERCCWPGRSQAVKAVGCSWFLDGAHTMESMEQCLRWFKATQVQQDEATATDKPRRVLVFGCQDDKNVESIFQVFKSSELAFDTVLFCPPSGAEGTEWEESLQAMWSEHQIGGEAQIVNTPEDAIDHVRAQEGEVEPVVLVTGSLYLVGSVIQLVAPDS